MGYKFLSVERGTSPGNNAETCALLHLMCFAEERDEISQFAIDCFNDVTGMDKSCFTLYDVQSKAGKNSTPSKLGEELVTLFENSVSAFSQFFVTFTLFVGGVSSSVLENPELEVFGFHDMKPEAQKSVREHLVAACRERHGGVFNDLITDENVDDFLCNKARFAIAKSNPTDYIRALACNTSELLPEDRRLMKIFTDIRDAQSAIKNRPSILGETINRPDEVMDYGRTLSAESIRLLVIQRLLNRDFLGDDVPDEFRSYLRTLPVEEDERDVIEESQSGLFRQYLDKNNREAFWTLLSAIVTILKQDRSALAEEVYVRIDVDTLKACSHMDKRSHLFFISVVKDGLRK